MLIASLLAPPLAARLAEVTLGVGAQLIRASSWDELDQLLQDSTVQIAVLDPCAGTPRDGELAAVRLLEHYPSTTVIAYTRLTPAAARTIVPLAQRGLYEVVLHQFDDSYPQFCHLLRRAAAQH